MRLSICPVYKGATYKCRTYPTSSIPKALTNHYIPPTQSNEPAHLSNTILIKRHLRTELVTRAVRVIAQRITLRILGREHQEPVVGHGKPEVARDVVVVGAGLVARAAGAMEPLARVDARGRDVAVVLARDRVAGGADRGVVRVPRGGRGEGGGCGQEEGG